LLSSQDGVYRQKEKCHPRDFVDQIPNYRVSSNMGTMGFSARANQSIRGDAKRLHRNPGDGSYADGK
jgi:hypothetical protein